MRARIAIALALLAGALLVLWPGDPPSPGDPTAPEQPDPTPTSTPPEEAPGGLFGRPGASSTGARTDDAVAKPAPDAERTVRVRVRVRMPDGSAPASGTGYVVATERKDGAPRLATLAPDGTIDVDLPVLAPRPRRPGEPGRSGEALIIGAVVPGFARHEQPLGVPEGAGRADVDVAIPEGEVLAGVVVDKAENPVGDLDLLAQSEAPRPFEIAASRFELPTLLRRGLVFARARTDAHGRFEMRVPTGIRFWFQADSRAWILHGHAGRDPGESRVLVAERAWALDVDVVDDDSGEPVPTYDVTLAVAPGNRRGWSHEYADVRGPLRYAQAWPEEFPPEMKAVFRAQDHRETTLTVAYASGRRAARETVRMRRLREEEKGRLVFDLGDLAGRAGMRLYRTEGRLRHAVPMGWIEAGRYVAVLPAGRHALEARLAGPFGELTRWSGEVEARAGRDVEVPLRFPPLGSLRIRRTVPGTPSSILVHVRSADGTLCATVETKEAEVAAVAIPEGAWSLTATGTVSRAFTVAPGRETVVDLDP